MTLSPGSEDHGTGGSALEKDPHIDMSRNGLDAELTDASPNADGNAWQPRGAWRLFRRLLLLRVAGDLLAVLLAVAAAWYLRFELGFLAFTEAEVAVGQHLLAAGVWSLSFFVALVLNRLYQEDTLFRGGGESTRILRSLFEASALLTFFIFVTQSTSISRSWLAMTVVGSGITLFTTRWAINRALRSARKRGAFRRPVLLLERSTGLERSFLFRDQEFEVIRKVSLEELALDPAAVLSRSHRHLPMPPLLLVKASDFEEEELWPVVIAAGEADIPVFISAAARSVSRDRLTVREVGGQTIVKVSPPNLSGVNTFLKRSFDLVLAAIGLVVLLPITLSIALVILVRTGTPILFRQERLGQEGRVFKMVKFRTMDESESSAEWTTAGDPRRTSVGRFLRRFSLDELPQLWNVLLGDMSLVGPRPEQPFFASGFADSIPSYRFRLRVKPGITGWAQAHGLRGDTSIPDRAEFDNWYIEHWSIVLDVSIILRTLGRIWTDRNAY